MKIRSNRVLWHRRGARAEYSGALRADDEGIRLSGCDRRTGVDVALLVPWHAVANLYRRSQGTAPEDVSVVIELWDAAPLVLREVGAGAHSPMALTRKLTEIWHARVPVQGGSR